MVTDFHRMVRAINDTCNDFDYLGKVAKKSAEDAAEVRQFLEWLTQENFVFMGVSVYEYANGKMSVVADKGLGSVRGLSEPS